VVDVVRPRLARISSWAGLVAMRIFYDVTRLCLRLARDAPTGIDRVDFETLAGLVERGEHVEGVLTSPWGPLLLRRETVAGLLDRLRQSWRVNGQLHDDLVHVSLARALALPADPGRSRAHRYGGRTRGASGLRAIGSLLSQARPAGGLLRRVTQPSVFYHASHLQLHRSRPFRWLAKTHIASVFFLHDVIPLEHPEFCGAGAAARHLARLRTLAEHGDLVLVNSQATADSVRRAFRSHDLRLPPLGVAPLGARKQPGLEWRPSGRAYFVVLGTIEPRKNLLFLLLVWRRLQERLGQRTPVLVMAGRRGWDFENVARMLDRSRTLAPYVIEAAALSDAGIADLLAGSRALLAPSLAEGFGLPVAEALVAGVPVIASDIPAHREIAAGAAVLLDPLDGPGWVAQIESFCRDDPPPPPNATGLRGWDRHVEDVMAALMEVAR
jgi:glycosyltransferase involved in cell wall biosynthesis